MGCGASMPVCVRVCVESIQGPSAVAGGIVGNSSTSATDLQSKAMLHIYSLRVRVCAGVCMFVDVRVCMCVCVCSRACV